MKAYPDPHLPTDERLRLAKGGLRGSAKQLVAALVLEDGTIDVPCGCCACDNGVQPGHFACELPEPLLVMAEQAGCASRHYEDGRWRWYAAE